MTPSILCFSLIQGMNKKMICSTETKLFERKTYYFVFTVIIIKLGGKLDFLLTMRKSSCMALFPGICQVPGKVGRSEISYLYQCFPPPSLFLCLTLSLSPFCNVSFNTKSFLFFSFKVCLSISSLCHIYNMFYQISL